jgi:hypothetical protein
MPHPDMYMVVVSHFGAVYEGADKATALSYYKGYSDRSSHNIGRSAGENVMLLKGGELYMEYHAPNESSKDNP